MTDAVAMAATGDGLDQLREKIFALLVAADFFPELAGVCKHGAMDISFYFGAIKEITFHSRGRDFTKNPKLNKSD